MTSPVDVTPGFFHASTRVAAMTTKQAASKPEPTAPPRGSLRGSSDLLLPPKGRVVDGPACNPGMFLLSSSGVLANLNLHQNLLKDLLTEVGGPQSASMGLGRGLRTCISHKLWGDVDAACVTHLENC